VLLLFVFTHLVVALTEVQALAVAAAVAALVI
jgi:hypothetical protein